MPKAIALITVLAALVLPATASAWPTWGNLESGDCAFAAAANWEMLHGGTTATEAQVLAEYLQAEPKDEGITGDELAAYWLRHGIGGRKARVHVRNPERLRRVMHRHGAVIAEVAINPGQRWTALTGGGVQLNGVLEQGGIHFAVVRYINRRGPVILTWGQLAQMTWWQWREDSMLVYYA